MQGSFALRFFQQHLDPCIQGGYRTAQIVPEDGNELVPQFPELSLGFLRVDEFAFIAPPFGRLEKRHSRKDQRAGRIALLDGIGEDRKQPSIGSDQVERYLVEEPLHPQQGREVRLVEDTAGNIQEITQALADELICGKAEP